MKNNIINNSIFMLWKEETYAYFMFINEKKYSKNNTIYIIYTEKTELVTAEKNIKNVVANRMFYKGL